MIYGVQPTAMVLSMKDIIAEILTYGAGSAKGADLRRIMAINLVIGMNLLSGVSYLLFCLIYDAQGNTGITPGRIQASERTLFLFP